MRPSTRMARPGRDAADPAPPEPDHADRAGAVVQLGLERRDSAARTEGDCLQGALDDDLLAVGCLVDGHQAGLPGVLAELLGLLAFLVRPATDGRAQATLVLGHVRSVVSCGELHPGTDRSSRRDGPRAAASAATAHREASPRRPRRTTTWRIVSSHGPARSLSSAGRPISVERSSQAGPSWPAIRLGWVAGSPSGVCIGTMHISSVPKVPSCSSVVPPMRAISAAIRGRSSSQAPPPREAANARSSSAPSSATRTTAITWPLSSSTCSCSSIGSTGVTSRLPRSTHSRSSTSTSETSKGPPDRLRGLG